MKYKPMVVASLALGMLVPTAAYAADPGPIYVPAADETRTYNSSQLDVALEEAQEREASGQTTAADDAIEAELISSSEAEGSPLTPEDIAVLHLGDAMTLAVPESTDLTNVEVIGGEASGGAADVVSVAVDSDAPEDASVASAGPGMGEWGSRVDGQYVITVKDPRYPNSSTVIGTGTFLWKREKYLNDGNGTYDWWNYSRKGIGQPKNVTGDDWQISKLRVQSYPYDAIEPGLVNWTDLEPSANFAGRCGSSSFTTGISTPVFDAGYSFVDCDQYVVWHNPDNPGSYHITMDQGNWVNEGSRSAGYTVGWKSRQGTGGSQHDYQRILFRRAPDSLDTTCASTDTSKACSGWNY